MLTWPHKTTCLSNSGAYVASVVQNGAAASAGIQTGDVIVQVDNTQVTNSQSLSEALANHNPGDTVAVQILPWQPANDDQRHTWWLRPEAKVDVQA